MKAKMCVGLVLMAGLSLGAGEACAALLSATALDQMKNNSLWYSQGGNSYFGRFWELSADSLDPSDNYVNALNKSDTSPNWYSYKTDTGFAFDKIELVAGRKYYGGVSLQYQINGAAPVDISWTSVQSLGGGNDWVSSLYTCDFSSMTPKPDQVIITMSSPQNWSFHVATTKLTVVPVPEPGTVGLLSLGGLMLRRRK